MPMNYLAVFLVGILVGIYLGNKKLRKRINRAVKYIGHKELDADLYDDDDED